MSTTYYLGKTSGGLIVKRSSTRSEYTHASVEMTTPASYTPGKRVGRKWVGGNPIGVFHIEHGPVVSLSRCHFSTSAHGAMKLLPKNYGGEVVEVKIVSAAEYNAAIKGEG